MSQSLHRVQESFRDQIRWAVELDAPFMVRLLGTCLEQLNTDSELRLLIGDWPGHPTPDALPIRVAGALHALVLRGESPELAALFPPNADLSDLSDSIVLGPAICRVIADHREHFSRYLANAPQTNEIRRSIVLLAGFSQIAELTAKPLRLLEIGASAGLNLNWDQYGYRFNSPSGSEFWGDALSRVQLSTEVRGNMPKLVSPIQVISRVACDQSPLDVNNDEHRLRLLSYVWPEQPERLERLRAAMEMARHLGVKVEQADAAQWVEAQLKGFASDTSQPGTTVLYHSVVWMYLPRATRRRIEAAMTQAAAKASDQHELAWLRYEFPRAGASAELSLSLWNGARSSDQTRVLAKCHPHGAWLAYE